MPTGFRCGHFTPTLPATQTLSAHLSTVGHPQFPDDREAGPSLADGPVSVDPESLVVGPVGPGLGQ